jgi:2'-5' RNA ligase
VSLPRRRCQLSEANLSSAYEAAIILPVAEAETLVGEFRLRFDPSAALGIPAHITINYPFKPYLSRADEVRIKLSSLFSHIPQFNFTLSEVRTFPGVVYLAPMPPDPFLALINAVSSLFPDSPPYEGQFEEPVPHLTVARVEDANLAPIEADFSKYAKRFLPLRCQARELLLMDSSEKLWKTQAIFPLKPL